jgi:hypothetical protein
MKGIRDGYKYYKAKGHSTLSVDEYAKVMNTWQMYIRDLIFEGNEVKLPSKMGIIKVSGKRVPIKFDEDGKLKGQSPDWAETKKLWANKPEAKENKQMIYHLNEHTDGVRYKFKWSKERMIVTNKYYYTMIFSRLNKRKLSVLIQDGMEYYVEPNKED